MPNDPERTDEMAGPDAERLVEELREQIARAKDKVRKFRDTLENTGGERPSGEG
jgi:hypothetical protein